MVCIVADLRQQVKPDRFGAMAWFLIFAHCTAFGSRFHCAAPAFEALNLAGRTPFESICLNADGWSRVPSTESSAVCRVTFEFSENRSKRRKSPFEKNISALCAQHVEQSEKPATIMRQLLDVAKCTARAHRSDRFARDAIQFAVSWSAEQSLRYEM